LAKAENTAENLSTTLTGLSVETGKATERASILAEQLEKTSLSLIMAREEKAIKVSKNECTICYLITLKIRNNTI
jgi:hypothetical protein